MPTLYVVATPIGNLGDMSPRAVEVLENVSLIAAEDTRVTAKLLNHFGIRTPLTSCHQHNEMMKGETLAQRMLDEGIDIALTTDAGTPGISDPGYGLTRACIERGIEVIAVPGACAMAAALSISGFDTREFAFYGFLPREKKELKEKLLSIARGVPIGVIHESPYRVIELMETIAEVLPQSRVSLSCDLTKLYEKTLHGTCHEVLADLKANPKADKGEYCLVLDCHEVTLPEEAPAVQASLEARLFEKMLAGTALREAQRELIAQGEKKNAVYQAALRVKDYLEELEEI
ncbi:MAG: 16S rRNA (cytidine(1402)-2'-O)-methyltransferase [Clostridia bacterium]|nr:16S rRNA (cytidine(1402)-2'-O)-methyltransferase [Clostridia bacterium]